MSKEIRICIIGAGNISNTRHIPAIKKDNRYKIVGIISDDDKKIRRTLDKHKELREVNQLLIDINDDIVSQLTTQKWFINEVDAVIIGTPPNQHYPMAISSLKLGKHVFVEKPMMMTKEECIETDKLAKEKHLVFYVMHSFQYSNGMNNLYQKYKDGELGELESILEIQLTNRKRRLPKWYNELPLGLFYDEAAHFFYGARRFGGELEILNANAQFNQEEDNTPKFIQIQAKSGVLPVQMYMNFNSPICEWAIILVGEKRIAIYDYFKDILIVLDNDQEHRAKDVLHTSFSFFIQFWGGFIKNGFKMVTGDLLYGQDICLLKFADAILEGDFSYELSSDLGIEVVGAMNKVIDLVK